MTGFSNANLKLSWSVRSFAAIGLGVGAEFLAECLKFMSGAALRTIQNLILLYSFNPMGEVRSFVKDMLIIGPIVGVLIYASVRVGRAIGQIIPRRGETVVLIISILITGLILEEIDQKKYQKEWTQHSSELALPIKGTVPLPIVPTK